MVIAPLLGPNIALAFGTSLGDLDLMGQALKTNLAGLGLALLLSVDHRLDLASRPVQRRRSSRAPTSAWTA